MWVRSSSAAALVAAFAVAIGYAQDPEEPLRIVKERTFSFDMRLDPATSSVAANTGAAGIAWSVEVRNRVPQGGALDGIRVEVRFDAPPAPGHTLRVLDGSDREVETFENPPQHLWTREVADGLAKLELRRRTAGPSPGATLAYAHHVVPLEMQAITGLNQIIFDIANTPPRIRRLGKSVARLRFMVAGEGQATCTAFLVGARLILTNEHCISNDAERASALVDFNYDSDGTAPSGLRVDTIIASSAALDYSLLRLASDPPDPTQRLYFAPANWKWAEAPQLHALVIVQHPSGLPKAVSITDCQLAGLNRIGVRRGDASDFGHLCDTLGGSSGSPVMDWLTGLVVGLHHFGFVAGSRDPVNQAVAHTRILADVAVKNGSAHAEMIQPAKP